MAEPSFRKKQTMTSLRVYQRWGQRSLSLNWCSSMSIVSIVSVCVSGCFVAGSEHRCFSKNAMSHASVWLFMFKAVFLQRMLMDGLSSPLGWFSTFQENHLLFRTDEARLHQAIIKRCMHQKSRLHGLSVSGFTEEVTLYTFIRGNSHQSHLIMTPIATL